FPFRGQGLTLPTLDEVLEAFPGMRMNVDLKAADRFLPTFFARVIRHHRAVARVCCGSESDEVAARLHQALPEACHFYPAAALTAFVGAVQAGEAPPDDPRF